MRPHRRILLSRLHVCCGDVCVCVCVRTCLRWKKTPPKWKLVHSAPCQLSHSSAVQCSAFESHMNKSELWVTHWERTTHGHMYVFVCHRCVVMRRRRREEKRLCVCVCVCVLLLCSFGSRLKNHFVALHVSITTYHDDDKYLMSGVELKTKCTCTQAAKRNKMKKICFYFVSLGEEAAAKRSKARKHVFILIPCCCCCPMVGPSN